MNIEWFDWMLSSTNNPGIKEVDMSTGAEMLVSLQAVLDSIRNDELQSYQEENIFQIGGRGHYENPTTQILGFFLDASRGHGFGTSLLDALLESINVRLDTSLPYRVESEVLTSEGLRMDLVLQSESWVIAVENKIRHWAANDFNSYASSVESMGKGKPLLILLSVAQEASPQGWITLRWEMLVEAFRDRIGPLLLRDVVPGKWPILLREYLNNIEFEWKKRPAMTEEKCRFAQQNYAMLVKAQQLRGEYLRAILADWMHRIDAMQYVVTRADIRGEWRFKDGNLTPLRFQIQEPSIEFNLKVWDTGLYGVNLEIPASLLGWKERIMQACSNEFRCNALNTGGVNLVGNDDHPTSDKVFDIVVRIFELLKNGGNLSE